MAYRSFATGGTLNDLTQFGIICSVIGWLYVWCDRHINMEVGLGYGCSRELFDFNFTAEFNQTVSTGILVLPLEMSHHIVRVSGLESRLIYIIRIGVGFMVWSHSSVT